MKFKYLVEIKVPASCSQYEEEVTIDVDADVSEAGRELKALHKVVRMLMEDGEIDRKDMLSYICTEIE